VIATITSDADDYAREVLAVCRKAGLRARDRPAQREDQLQGARHSPAKVRRCWWSARRKPKPARCRSAVSAGRLDVLPLDEALKMLVDEATPPDVKRARTAA